MINSPLISVIIPTYKRSKLLPNAIESVLNQTYKNIEIIVVDDNLPNSIYRKENIDKLHKFIINNQITYIQNEKNLGGALARNEGIIRSNGEFIAFLDDDDIFLPTKLEKQIKVFQNDIEKKLGLVYCYCDGINLQGTVLWKSRNNLGGLPLYESMLDCIANTSLWLCRKDMLLKIGGFQNTPSKQDNLLMVKIIANGYEIQCVEEVLANYLEHDYGKISTDKPRESIKLGLENLRNYCRGNYNQLTRRQKKIIENEFSKKLYTQYRGLGESYNLLREGIRRVLNKPFCKESLYVIWDIGRYMLKK